MSFAPGWRGTNVINREFEERVNNYRQKNNPLIIMKLNPTYVRMSDEEQQAEAAKLGPVNSVEESFAGLENLLTRLEIPFEKTYKGERAVVFNSEAVRSKEGVYAWEVLQGIVINDKRGANKFITPYITRTQYISRIRKTF